MVPLKTDVIQHWSFQQPVAAVPCGPSWYTWSVNDAVNWRVRTRATLWKVIACKKWLSGWTGILGESALQFVLHHLCKSYCEAVNLVVSLRFISHPSLKPQNCFAFKYHRFFVSGNRPLVSSNCWTMIMRKQSEAFNIESFTVEWPPQLHAN